MSEAWLKLVVADLVVAGKAFRAPAAAADKGDGHPVTHFPLRHVFTCGYNIPCQFMARYMGQLYVRVVAGPAVPVAQADAARHDLEHDAARRRHRVRDLLDPDDEIIIPEPMYAAYTAMFAAIGAMKSRWSLVPAWRSALETLAIGILAAGVAYVVGLLLDKAV